MKKSVSIQMQLNMSSLTVKISGYSPSFEEKKAMAKAVLSSLHPVFDKHNIDVNSLEFELCNEALFSIIFRSAAEDLNISKVEESVLMAAQKFLRLPGKTKIKISSTTDVEARQYLRM